MNQNGKEVTSSLYARAAMLSPAVFNTNGHGVRTTAHTSWEGLQFISGYWGSRPVCAEELQDSRLPTFPDHALIRSQQKMQENNFNAAPAENKTEH